MYLTEGIPDILYCATRCDPSRRFPNVAAFREALDSVIQDNDEPVKKTIHTERILKVLKQDIFSSENISMLSDFLSSNIIDDEKNAVLSEISLDHIQKIIKDGTHFSFIARAYCEYVRNNSFTWNFCDTLANRIALFIDNGSVDIKAEGILALLYMGTSHNRWYVERKFVNYISGDIERSLLKRMQIEIAIENTEFVYAISHLCRSINTTIDSFNTDIANSIRKVNNND